MSLHEGGGGVCAPGSSVGEGLSEVDWLAVGGGRAFIHHPARVHILSLMMLISCSQSQAAENETLKNKNQSVELSKKLNSVIFGSIKLFN